MTTGRSARRIAGATGCLLALPCVGAGIWSLLIPDLITQGIGLMLLLGGIAMLIVGVLTIRVRA